MRSASARAFAGPQLEVDQTQLAGKVRVGELELATDPGERLVEAEACFDADDEQIEHIGERESDLVRAALRQARQDHSRQQVTGADTGQREREVRTHHNGRRKDREQHQREDDADTEEDRQRFVTTKAGLHEAESQAAELAGRSRGPFANALDESHERLHGALFVNVLAIGPQLFQPAIDGDGLSWHQRKGRCRHDQRAEDECE